MFYKNQQLLAKIITNKLAVSCTTDTFLKNQTFVDAFETEDYECAALRKELLIARFVERFKTITLGKPY